MSSLMTFDTMTEGALQNGEAIQQQAAMDNTVPISLKLLATHLGVGAIIGKHGSSITEIQSASGAKIQISGPNEVFPGTTERVMHLSGEMLKVMSALHMIMQKWKQENVFRDHVDMDPNHVLLKIVMLGKLCGAVIGENGKTINDIKIATHTDIRVQSREDCVRGVNERIITICSEENYVLQAVGRILKKCLEDKAFEEYRTTSLAYTAGGSMISGMQNLRLQPDDPLTFVPCHFTLQLTNEQAGAVLGVKGSNINTIIKMSGAKVSMQSRNEVDDGDLRSLSISGQFDSCSTALGMVTSKLRETGRARGPPRAGGSSRGGSAPGAGMQ